MGVTVKKFNKAKDFRRAVTEYAEKAIEVIVIDTQKAIAESVWMNILLTTPVLSGKARRNWHGSVTVPNLFQTNDVAGVQSTGAPVSGSETSRIRKTVALLNNRPLGQIFWIANSLPYVPGLEMGTSAKAPSGIRDVSIRRALAGGVKVRRV